MSQDEKDMLSNFILTQFTRLEDRIEHRFDRVDARLDKLEEKQQNTKLKLATKSVEQDNLKERMKYLTKVLGVSLLAGSGGGLTFSAVVKALLPGG